MTEENEKKKEYLYQYKQAVKEMERSDLKLHELRLSKMCPSVINDGMPHASGHSDLSDYAVLLDEAERDCIRYRYLRIKLCNEITDKIEKLNNEDEKDVMTYRYIKLMKWEDICVTLNFSWKWTHKLHSRALENLKV